MANAFANAIGQSLRQASPLRWQRPLGLDEQHRPGLANDDEVDFPTRIIVAGSEEPGMLRRRNSIAWLMSTGSSSWETWFA
ncbi:hypothetical protein BF95_02830 [Sphingobium sp. Ant17]|nr:hypothetical protein BF95_02830 [Sphingobium sp. Ant17]